MVNPLQLERRTIIVAMSMYLNWKNKADDEEAEAEGIVVGIEAALEALEEIEAEAALEE
jgi:hypothetical protein